MRVACAQIVHVIGAHDPQIQITGDARYTRVDDALLVDIDTGWDDPAAAVLLADAARALEALAAALHPTLPLALAGSIALRLAPRLSPALQSRRVEPQGDAAAGALWLIQQQEKNSA